MCLVRFIQVFTFCSSSITFLIDTFFKIVDQKHWLLLHMRNFNYDRTQRKGKIPFNEDSLVIPHQQDFFVPILFCLICKFLNVCTIFFIIKEVLEDAGKGKE